MFVNEVHVAVNKHMCYQTKFLYKSAWVVYLVNIDENLSIIWKGIYQRVKNNIIGQGFSGDVIDKSIWEFLNTFNPRTPTLGPT